MLKKMWDEHGHRIYICMDMGILFMGIFMTFIATYRPICGDIENEVRASIGAICMTIWFIMFPAISRDEKDKIMLAIGTHLLLLFVALIVSWLEVIYFLQNMTHGKLFSDILFCVGGILVISYLLYILVGFIKTFFYMIEKAKDFIFPQLKEVSGLINVIEAITAGLLSITAFGASIVGVVTLAKQFIGMF